METRTLILICFAIVGSAPLCFAATGDLLFAPIKEKCATEQAMYCKAAMPTDARLALCLYAHEDKLSAPCALAVYDGMVALRFALSTHSAYAKTCRQDLLKNCATTKWGEGRLFACLVENRLTLKPTCRSALDGARPDLQTLGIVK